MDRVRYVRELCHEKEVRCELKLALDAMAFRATWTDDQDYEMWWATEISEALDDSEYMWLEEPLAPSSVDSVFSQKQKLQSGGDDLIDKS